MRKIDKDKRPFLRHLGDAIRYRRVDLLLSQGELGERSGLHRSYITDVENGSRNLSIMTLARVAKALQGPLSSPIMAAEKAMNKEEKNK
jgi:transcriptional regulator with XRE-family HTH domain